MRDCGKSESVTPRTISCKTPELRVNFPQVARVQVSVTSCMIAYTSLQDTVCEVLYQIVPVSQSEVPIVVPERAE